MTATIGTQAPQDVELVLAVLEAAGARGASHEDFVEAGLARGYVAALRHLVDEAGIEIRIDFTTGVARWSMQADSATERQAA
jgi:hypothetical protein